MCVCVSLLNLSQQSRDDSLIAHHRSMTRVTEVHPSRRRRRREEDALRFGIRLIGRFRSAGERPGFERCRGTKLFKPAADAL